MLLPSYVTVRTHCTEVTVRLQIAETETTTALGNGFPRVVHNLVVDVGIGPTCNPDLGQRVYKTLPRYPSQPTKGRDTVDFHHSSLFGAHLGERHLVCVRWDGP